MPFMPAPDLDSGASKGAPRSQLSTQICSETNLATRVQAAQNQNATQTPHDPNTRLLPNCITRMQRSLCLRDRLVPVRHPFARWIVQDHEIFCGFSSGIRDKDHGRKSEYDLGTPAEERQAMIQSWHAMNAAREYHPERHRGIPFADIVPN